MAAFEPVMLLVGQRVAQCASGTSSTSGTRVEPASYTRAFGAAALGIGTGLSIARTRRRSAVLAGAFFIAVMPAKVRLAVSWWRDGTKRLPARTTGVVQLFWQVPLVTEAWRAWRNAPN
ncbi:hypothetical protein [Salinifilum ghardaiensis]